MDQFTYSISVVQTLFTDIRGSESGHTTAVDRKMLLIGKSCHVITISAILIYFTLSSVFIFHYHLSHYFLKFGGLCGDAVKSPDS